MTERSASEPGTAASGAGAAQQVPARPPRTRVSTAFSGFVAGAIVLILLLIFILENTKSVRISFLGAGGHVAIGVALLVAAVGGALVVGILGAARIGQVRRHAKRRGQAPTR
jgi:lipopolysaccharide assembly protein A